MPFTQIIIRIIANTIFLLKKEEISQSNSRFLIFTGTSGKTTMKDAVYTTLQGLNIRADRSVHGYNNELGVILTILGIQNFSIKKPKDWLNLLKKKVIKNRFICIELGADFYKDTSWFLNKFSPYGVFISSSDPSSWSRNISEVEDDRKMLFKATVSDGFIAYNYDDVTIQKLVKESGSGAKLLPFSLKGDSRASVFLEFWKNPFMTFQVNEAAEISDQLSVSINNILYEIELPRAIFEPQVYGILASYTCIYYISTASLEKVSKVVTRYQFSENRLQVYVAKNGAVIVEDSYKATPLCTFWYLDMSSKLIVNKKILVLSEMRPLSFSINEHYKTMAQKTLFAENVYFLGPKNLFAKFFEINPLSKWISVDMYNNLSKEILKNSENGDVILLKGSFRYKLDELRRFLV